MKRMLGHLLRSKEGEIKQRGKGTGVIPEPESALGIMLEVEGIHSLKPLLIIPRGLWQHLSFTVIFVLSPGW